MTLHEETNSTEERRRETQERGEALGVTAQDPPPSRVSDSAHA
jgi:hypothetical protein